MNDGHIEESPKLLPVNRTERELAGLPVEDAPQIHRLDYFEEKALDIRIEAARVAHERTRLAFFASTVVSLAILAAGWNAYFSFYYDFASGLPSFEGGSGTESLQKEILAEWVRSRMINISPLGIRVGVDDAPLLGGFALVVSAIWLFYSIRRENFTIGMLLVDYYYAKQPLKWCIYHGVNSSTVFTNVSHGDDPFRSATSIPSDNQLKLIRRMAKHLWYLPIFSLWFIILVDILSAFWYSPFRTPDAREAFERVQNHEALRNQVKGLPPRPWPQLDCKEREDAARILRNAQLIGKQQSPWEGLSGLDRVHALLQWFLSILISVPLFFICRRTASFSEGTEEALAQFFTSLFGSEPPRSDHSLYLPLRARLVKIRARIHSAFEKSARRTPGSAPPTGEEGRETTAT
jgi:hypothetical protein